MLRQPSIRWYAFAISLNVILALLANWLTRVFTTASPGSEASWPSIAKHNVVDSLALPKVALAQSDIFFDDVSVAASIPRSCAFRHSSLWRSRAVSSSWWPPSSLPQSLTEDYSGSFLAKYSAVEARVYVSDGDLHFSVRSMWTQSRIPSVLFVMSSALHAFDNETGSTTASAVPPPGDSLMLMSMRDSPILSAWDAFDENRGGGAPFPLLSSCGKDDFAADIAVPDYIANRWESNIDPLTLKKGSKELYTETLDSIFSTAAAVPYEQRFRKALFRGNWKTRDRACIKHVFKRRPDLFDGGLNPDTVDAMPARIPLRDFPHYAFHVCISGNGVATRLPYLLASGSPVIYFSATSKGQMYLFYMRDLIPWVHYVPMAHENQLIPLTEWLLDHPVEARAIGEAGQRFVREYLTRDGILCYWRSFLALMGSVTKGEIQVPSSPSTSLTRVGPSMTFKELEAAARQSAQDRPNAASA